MQNALRVTLGQHSEAGHKGVNQDFHGAMLPTGPQRGTKGIALALAAEAPQMQVRTVEPDGFDDVKRSLASGRIERNAQSSGSICDAILTPAPSELTFGILKQYCGAGIAVSDAEALAAMKAAFDRLRVVIEPGGAAALAAAMFHRSEIAADTVIVTASGGNVDPSVFIRALQE